MMIRKFYSYMSDLIPNDFPSVRCSDSEMRMTIETYNFISRDFAKQTSNLDDYPGVKKDINDFIAAIRGKRILDAGAGSCRDALFFLKNGFMVEAIDLAEDMLRAANEIFPETTKRVMDVTNLGYDNNTFDGVWCNAVLLHLNCRYFEKALHEFWRVLKRNGLLYISVKEGSGKEIVPVKGFEQLYRTYYLQSPESVNQALVNTGFKVKRINTRTEIIHEITTKWVTVFSCKI